MRKLLALLFVFYASAAIASFPDQAQWEFEVLLDGKKIGYHNFAVSEEEGNQVVSSEAKFDVKLLFVNVFSYRHQLEETWRDNCLDSISAETVSNGDDFMVNGELVDGAFQLTPADSTEKLPPCVKTFAYWNPDFLTAEKLLNSQTGEYEAVSIVREGREELLLDGEELQAVRYSIEGAAAPITLWYSAADYRWLALESVVRGGRILRYEPVNLPEPLPVSLAVAE